MYVCSQVNSYSECGSCMKGVEGQDMEERVWITGNIKHGHCQN